MYHVLVVEDDPAQMQAMCAILQNYNAGFQVKTASSFDAAIDLVKAENFDIFLLDLKLDSEIDSPKNGVRLGIEIRTYPIYQYTPIIFITSVPEKIHEALNETGCFRYLLKPYREEDLIRCLEQLLHSPLVKPSEFSFLSYWGGRINLPENDILYISPGTNRRIYIIADSGRYETVDYTMSQLESMLKHNFVRCHRKYLINFQRISDYDKGRQLIYLGDFLIPVGRTYKTNFEHLWRIS